MADKKKKDRLVLVDGHSLLFRAFYAIPYLTSPDGAMVNAVYGFASILLSVIEELKPTHMAICFDSEGPTFRKDGYEKYKANRQKAPEEFKEQVPRAFEVVEKMNMPMFAVKGFEADDLIGTIAEQARDESKHEIETVIVTGDQDIFQLVENKKVLVFIPGMRSKPSIMYGEEEVEQKLGVRKDQVVDYKGLAGDSSDNIPGIRGIGPKTAVELLKKFENLEGVYNKLDEARSEVLGTESESEEIEAKQLKEIALKMGVGVAVVAKLIEGRELAFKSRELATIMREVPIELKLEDCRVTGYDKRETVALFEKFGFKSLIKRLPADEFEMSVQEALF